MTQQLLQGLNNSIHTILLLVTFINVVLHLIFASAVAKDAGELTKLGRSTYLVSGIVWAFATLVGGVFIAVAYWLMHYSTLARGKTL
jgi:uncharacterized membrane protein (UPF0182 family)